MLKQARLHPCTKHIWNILEDWRVERVLAALYPGCQQNLDWLIRHLFLKPDSQSEGQPLAPELLFLNWLLFTVRSWTVPELQSHCAAMASQLEQSLPGLLAQVEPLVLLVPDQCHSTQDVIHMAEQIAGILRAYVYQRPETKPTGPKDSNVSSNGQKSARQSLKALLDGNAATLPTDMGSILAQRVEQACSQATATTQLALVSHKQTFPLSGQHIDAARRETVSLRTRLQALLQSLVRQRTALGTHGRLNTRTLHRLALGDARLFLRQQQKKGLNTLVHILLDSSGSMNGKPLELASMATFAVASALHSITGIHVAVSTFPADSVQEKGMPRNTRTVAPLLRPGEKLHTRFQISASGGTPMAEALWWVLLDMHARSQSRKVILLVTDGEPDVFATAQAAISAARLHGCEVYGLGINTQSVTTLLPAHSKVIHDVRDLAPGLFDLLEKALLGKP